MKKSPLRELWNEFEWELELRKDDARVNTYIGELPKYIDLPDEDAAIMRDLRKRPELTPSGGDWESLGSPLPPPADDDDAPCDEAEADRREREYRESPEWRNADGGTLYCDCAVLARDWAMVSATVAKTPEMLKLSMGILCIYGKLMARSSDLIDMSLDGEDPAPSALRIAVCKRLLADINSLAGELISASEKETKFESEAEKQVKKLSSLRSYIFDVLMKYRASSRGRRNGK